jgi:hypothetical protein
MKKYLESQVFYGDALVGFLVLLLFTLLVKIKQKPNQQLLAALLDHFSGLVFPLSDILFGGGIGGRLIN